MGGWALWKNTTWPVWHLGPFELELGFAPGFARGGEAHLGEKTKKWSWTNSNNHSVIPLEWDFGGDWMKRNSAKGRKHHVYRVWCHPPPPGAIRAEDHHHENSNLVGEVPFVEDCFGPTSMIPGVKEAKRKTMNSLVDSLVQRRESCAWVESNISMFFARRLLSYDRNKLDWRGDPFRHSRGIDIGSRAVNFDIRKACNRATPRS